jgi:hypothetical protein
VEVDAQARGEFDVHDLLPLCQILRVLYQCGGSFSLSARFAEVPCHATSKADPCACTLQECGLSKVCDGARDALGKIRRSHPKRWGVLVALRSMAIKSGLLRGEDTQSF